LSDYPGNEDVDYGLPVLWGQVVQVGEDSWFNRRCKEEAVSFPSMEMQGEGWKRQGGRQMGERGKEVALPHISCKLEGDARVGEKYKKQG